MKKALALTALAIACSLSGCASSGSCNSGGNGWFGSRILQDQPVRRTIRSWFQGDACSTCNAPAGQLNGLAPNTAPLCENCGNQPMFQQNQGAPLYNSPIIGPTNDFNMPQQPILDPGAIQSDGGLGPAFSSGRLNNLERGNVLPPNF